MAAVLDSRLPQTSINIPDFIPDWTSSDVNRPRPQTAFGSAPNITYATYVPPITEGVPIRDNDIGVALQDQFLQGNRYIQGGRFAEAINVFEVIVMAFPASYAAHFNLGFAYG